MTAHTTMKLNRFAAILGLILEHIQPVTAHFVNRTLQRYCMEGVKPHTALKRSQRFLRNISENIQGTDYSYSPILFVRSVTDTTSMFHTCKHIAAYIRKMNEQAENIGETRHEGDYYRLNSETVQADGNVLRSLTLCIRIITRVLLRDYLIRRFLIAKEELKLKSCISREIILESKII